MKTFPPRTFYLTFYLIARIFTIFLFKRANNRVSWCISLRYKKPLSPVVRKKGYLSNFVYIFLSVSARGSAVGAELGGDACFSAVRAIPCSHYR